MIKPRKLQVLIKPQADEEKETEFGILLPSNLEQEKKAIGEVVAVGDKIDDIKKGDTVIYALFAGERIKLNEKGKEVEYMLLFEEDILAFYEV